MMAGSTKETHLKMNRYMKHFLLLITLSSISVYLSFKMSRSFCQDVTSKRYVLGAGIVDVTQFGLKEENQSSIKETGSVFHKLSECYKNTAFDSVGDEVPCLRNDSFGNTFACKHLMALGYRNLGRTGNQMFQVAALLGTARYHGYTAVLDRSLSIAAWFELPNISRVNISSTRRRFTEKVCCKFDERVKNLSHESNWTLGGYFQSWRYFEGSEEVIKHTFKLKENFLIDARSLITSAVSSDTETVCIHVRRGDFISSSNRGYSIAPIEYIQKAVTYFRNKYKRVHFFVVSDDRRWCRNKLNWANVTVSPLLTVGQDMALMVECDHVIVTSGSFGWWGAWLSGGETVYWTGYPKKGTWLGNQTNYDDYYPSHWIGF